MCHGRHPAVPRFPVNFRSIIDARARSRCQAPGRVRCGHVGGQAPAVSVAAVVLAAGAGTRFGGPKQRLLLPRVLERLRETSVEDVVVVAGAYGLEAEGVRVVAAWRESAADLVAASYGGVRGHPLLLARALWDAVPDEGFRALAPLLVPCDDLGYPGDVDRVEDLR